MFPCRYNNALYGLVEMQIAAMQPLVLAARSSKNFYSHFFSGSRFGRSIAAGYEMVERLAQRYEQPNFNISRTEIDGVKVKVHEERIVHKTFCNLVHFKKSPEYNNQPKFLLVAPMSGHFATLLRGTVEGLLPYADVYITDWINVRDIPEEKGQFRFDDYVNYVIEFCQRLGSDLTVVAVCQPSVPVMVAVDLMTQNNDPNIPANIVLMGGPIDTRKSPTEVNNYASSRTIKWFEENAITVVPQNYKGSGRLVYPGFMQLCGFLAMNLQTHIRAHWDLFKHLVEGDGESVWSHKKFYNEYLAVMDLPAEFYLDTIRIVFKEYLLPRGMLISNGKNVRLENIVKPKLLCIEGERDDISGRGQTKAAINLCRGIPDQRKHYHLQEGVGHFGIFNGRRYREEIVPLMIDFINSDNFKKETNVMSIAKKPAVKKAAIKKPAAKKAAPKKAAPKKVAVKKEVIKKTEAKKEAPKKMEVKKAAPKKMEVKKAAPKKAAIKKPAEKK